MLFMISGKQRSGKDTVVNMLERFFVGEGKNVYRLSFAGPLKVACRKEFYNVIEVLKPYGEVIPDLNIPENDDGDKSKIWRRFLQDFGESKKVGDLNHWTKMVMNRYNFVMTVDPDAICILNDLRHEHELDYVKSEISNDVVTIRVNRERQKSAHGENHISEVSLDGYEDWDYMIDNNGSLSELESRVGVIHESIRG